LAKKYNFTLLLRWRKPITGFLDKYWIKLYNAYELTVSVADMHNYTKVVGPQPFWAADFTKYNFIFKYLWLVKVNPKIYFKIGTFK
jgi:hypothetical protein